MITLATAPSNALACHHGPATAGIFNVDFSLPIKFSNLRQHFLVTHQPSTRMPSPFSSPRTDSSCNEDRHDPQTLRPRRPVPEPKGGGGHSGGHSGAKGKSSGSGSKGASGKASVPVGSRGSPVPISGTTFGSGKTTSTAYGSGGVKVTTIPQGQPFAGRTYGGGTRGEIYGTS